MATDSLTTTIESLLGSQMDAADTDSPDEDTPATQDVDETPAEDEQTEPGDEDTEDDVEADAEDEPDDEESDEDPDEEDDADEEDSDAEDEEGDDEGTLELDEDTVLVIPDGTEVSAKELQGGYLRQADYTRKTQELAEQRKQIEAVYDNMAAWYEERSQNPSAWISEIAQSTDDPAKALADAVASTGNADIAFAGLVRTLVEGGHLADELVQRLGLTKIAEEAKQTAGIDRVKQLEDRLERERQEREQAERQQQILGEYNRQWDGIVQTEGLEFTSEKEEYEAKVDLMRYALNKEIADLPTAWAAMTYERSRQAPKDAPAPKPTRKRAKDAVDRKRRASASNRQSTASGSSQRPIPKRDLDSAAERALEDMGI